MLREGSGASQRGMLSPREISQVQQLARAPYRKTEIQMGQWWVGPQVSCSGVHNLALYLNLDLTSEPPKWTWGDSYWTTQKKSFSSFSETLSWCIWSRISLWFGCTFLPDIPSGQFLTSLSTICSFPRGHACLNPSSVLNCLVILLFYIQILYYCCLKVTVFWVGD